MNFRTRKVAIVGTGHVGSHCAFSLLTQGFCDELVLIDIDTEKAKGHAIDLTDALAYLPHYVRVRQGELADCKDADVVVISAGPLPDKNQTRLDTMGATGAIVKAIIPPIVQSGFNGIFVVITNPVDIIAHYVWKLSGFPKHRVIGTGTALDSARLRRVIAEEAGIEQRSIQAYALGEHGDSQLVVWSHVTLAGKPLKELMAEQPETYGKLDLEEMAHRTARAGYVVLYGKGSTEFGIGTALAEIVRAIFRDEKRILPISTLLEGQYGQQDVYAGVPAVLGKDGVESVIELNLTASEQAKFDRSCQVMKEYIAVLQSQ